MPRVIWLLSLPDGVRHTTIFKDVTPVHFLPLNGVCVSLSSADCLYTHSEYLLTFWVICRLHCRRSSPVKLLGLRPRRGFRPRFISIRPLSEKLRNVIVCSTSERVSVCTCCDSVEVVLLWWLQYSQWHAEDTNRATFNWGWCSRSCPNWLKNYNGRAERRYVQVPYIP